MGFLRGVALAWGMSLLAAAGPAAVPAKPAAAAGAVIIPFAPPIGTTLHLHLTRRIVDMQGTAESVVEDGTSEEELAFAERNAAGYVLRWTTRTVTIRAAADRQAILEAVNAVAIGKPIVIQLDANGAPAAVLNLAEIRSVFTAALDAMVTSIDARFAAKTPAEREGMRKALDGIAGMYRSLTDAQLTALVLEEPQTIFGLGGTALTRGKSLPFMTSVPLPLVNQAVGVQGRVELTEAGAGELAIRSTTSTNAADVKAATTGYLEKLLAGIAPAQREQATATIARLQGFEASSELLLTLDAKSGVVKRATYRKRSGIAGQARAETKTFALVN